MRLSEIGSSFRPDLLLADWLLAGQHERTSRGDGAAGRPAGDMDRFFLTALRSDRLTEQARHVQPCTFVEKPCDFDALLVEIRHLTRPPD